MEQLTKEELILINNVLATARIFSVEDVEKVVKPILTKLRVMIEPEGEVVTEGEVAN